MTVTSSDDLVGNVEGFEHGRLVIDRLDDHARTPDACQGTPGRYFAQRARRQYRFDAFWFNQGLP
ncbi:hypothetical protein [Burkholderia cepacia]|uniref:hypothetical protein n=1 Tax=Burkholderia cepacia TaxID=292 RepID=UPI00398F2C2A